MPETILPPVLVELYRVRGAPLYQLEGLLCISEVDLLMPADDNC